MSLKSRGISLVEAILATFLAGIFLVILANLTSSLRQVTSLSQQKGGALGLRGSIFPALRNDLSEAVEVKSPSSASEVGVVKISRLKLQGLTPSTAVGARLSSPPGTQVGYFWDPLAADHRESIVYDKQGTSLRRQVGTAPAQVVASIQSLQARQREKGLFEIKLGVSSGARSEILKCLVDLR